MIRTAFQTAGVIISKTSLQIESGQVKAFRIRTTETKMISRAPGGRVLKGEDLLSNSAGKIHEKNERCHKMEVGAPEIRIAVPENQS